MRAEGETESELLDPPATLVFNEELDEVLDEVGLIVVVVDEMECELCCLLNWYLLFDVL